MTDVITISVEQLCTFARRGDYGLSDRHHCLCHFLPYENYVSPLYLATTQIPHRVIAAVTGISLEESAGGMTRLIGRNLTLEENWTSRDANYFLTREIFERALSNGIWLVTNRDTYSP